MRLMEVWEVVGDHVLRLMVAWLRSHERCCMELFFNGYWRSTRTGCSQRLLNCCCCNTLRMPKPWTATTADAARRETGRCSPTLTCARGTGSQLLRCQASSTADAAVDVAWSPILK